MKRLTLIAGVLLLFASFTQAQQGGRITGQVTDAKTGDPLPGVNIIVRGTYYGAATDEKGQYQILNISPGNYELQVSMIGYKRILKTGVNVTAGERVTLNFELEQTSLALGQEVEVIGERPLIDVDETSSTVRMGSDDIDNQIVNTVDNVIQQQVGVSSVDNEIHIRGGRVDESLYVIDGMSIKDPLSGNASNVFITAEAVEELEVITGGFNAEYGQAMSGVIDVKLKAGSDRYTGGFTYITDKWAPGVFRDFNTDRLEFNIGGPELLNNYILKNIGLELPGKWYFFVSGYGRLSDTYLPHASELYPARDWQESFARREENDYHLLGKLTWKKNAQQTLSYSYDRSLKINQGFFMNKTYTNTYYPYYYENILDNYNTMTRENIINNLSWTHTLNSRTFYELSLGRFFTDFHSAARGLHYSEYREHQDLEPIRYEANANGNINVEFGDEFWDQGMPPDWFDYWSENLSAEFDFTYTTGGRHTYKTGFDMRATTMQLIHIDTPWWGDNPFGRAFDIYRVRPFDGAFYLQDKIVFDGMIVNIGMRYDFWFPGEKVDELMTTDMTSLSPTINDFAKQTYKEETFEFFGRRGKAHLSPRLGISHPVSDNDVLYFNYGHFSQLPTYQYVYANLFTRDENSYSLFGNPNLSPKTTVSYELGIKHKFDENTVLEFRSYYKDMFDYETSASITLFDPAKGNQSFLMYLNMDYARARGVEIVFRKRFGRYFAGDANFSYSQVTGKSSTPYDNLLVTAGRLDEKPLGESFLSWDRPVSFFANLHFTMDRERRPHLLGLPMPNDWRTSFRIEYNSGRRYTPYTNISLVKQGDTWYYDGDRRSDEPYSAITPSWWNMDVKISKTLYDGIFRSLLVLEIENIFDYKIPRRINPFTGEPYDPGETIPYYLANAPNPNFDPSRYREGRVAKLGMKVDF
ncbi:MAG: TonB-dependent receptor [Candidatus Marinimicrobia bacterium]|nr:TonB-dependent receptor [Candidatus Neomarinimicrobiota bacterium]MCF7829076.1 TonB-dependent receptor [Candidatus Neomarinimicrobiota bacterium]MCF7881525.1 TonB-dependent receptor [Candidatus Neomarinimicrobiota bacterium]